VRSVYRERVGQFEAGRPRLQFYERLVVQCLLGWGDDASDWMSFSGLETGLARVLSARVGLGSQWEGAAADVGGYWG
jgi:hypothetical protein